MPFEKIEATNIAVAAADQIRTLIAHDVLRPGDQLPGERDLAARLHISRTSLRAALQTLTAEGFLTSKQGSGLFVRDDFGRSISDPLITLIESSDKAIQDYIGFRKVLECDSAAYVARNGTQAEKDHIARLHDALTQAYEGLNEADMLQIDEDFHMAIVEATGNIVTVQVARSMADLLKTSIAKSHSVAFHGGNGLAEIVGHHEAINASIQNSDPEAARAAMATHLDHFAGLIKSQNDVRRREKIIGKREEWRAAKTN